MKNPFSKNGAPQQKVPRYSWDFSFQNNLTFNYGELIPCCCIPVMPGDEIKLKTVYGLRFMPTAFPIQTRQRATIEFFYVRLRNLWSDFPDFMGKTLSAKKAGRPWMSPVNKRNKDMYGTGGLGDYLGLPTTLVGNFNFSTYKPTPTLMNGWLTTINAPNDPHVYNSASLPISCHQFSSNLNGFGAIDDGFFVGGTFYQMQDPNTNDYLPESVITFDYFATEEHIVGNFIYVMPCVSAPDNDGQSYYFHGYNTSSQAQKSWLAIDVNDLFDWTDLPLSGTSTSFFFNSLSFKHSVGEDGVHVVSFKIGIKNGRIPYGVLGTCRPKNSKVPSLHVSSITTPDVSDVIEWNGAQLPWDASIDEHSAAINAFRFRAYESIYNAFYRDERNNPYVLNGEKEYNKYLPTTDGGEDRNIYKIHYRNWEQDQFTTAVPTPQQGIAPLVGITSTGSATFSNPDDGKLYTADLEVSDDGSIAGVKMTENIPAAVARSLVDVATSGISINDFRNVNAFQRWLETNIRRGYKFRDVIKSHFDVDVSYAELDMPEFIGGTSCPITPTTVSQTTEGLDPLGSYAGQLYASGSSSNSIHKYFDEWGYLIGIISAVPVPNYSQVMDKDWFKGADPFDYYWPEFGQIGMQPVMTRELAPIQLSNDPSRNFDTDVFGYQRPWYEYMSKVDEVHGLFRTSLANFVMNRTFDKTPVLGADFTLVDPKQLNDVFSVQDISHKILGQIYFDIDFKRPIPRTSNPRLE